MRKTQIKIARAKERVVEQRNLPGTSRKDIRVINAAYQEMSNSAMLTVGNKIRSMSELNPNEVQNPNEKQDRMDRRTALELSVKRDIARFTHSNGSFDNDTVDKLRSYVDKNHSDILSDDDLKSAVHHLNEVESAFRQLVTSGVSGALTLRDPTHFSEDDFLTLWGNYQNELGKKLADPNYQKPDQDNVVRFLDNAKFEYGL